MGRNLVVFADGTGNSFFTQESNIWRLYEALDQRSPEQIAFYISGVGTAGWRPLALIDGATGLGVPANVRKLYRFLCWNYREGDNIYLFGFSRGAFTVRALVGMIHMQGLLPTSIDGARLSHSEMTQLARSAWRGYRANTAPYIRGRVSPLIHITRAVRDAWLWLWHSRRRAAGRDYGAAVREMRRLGRAGECSRGELDIDKAANPGTPIRFLGLFDTVEAFGVPFEEMRVAIDRFIWPISFRNGKLSGSVKFARHALSLDDERVTFHPIRFDRLQSPDPERIQEIWFAGVHSDVGGGYPNDVLSYIPLLWIADEAAKQGLIFAEGALEPYRRAATPLAPMHDSRSGGDAFYRYKPRSIGVEETEFPTVIDSSVVEKIALSPENYAPVAAPSDALVRLPNDERDRVLSLQLKIVARGGVDPDDRVERALMAIQEPDEILIGAARDLIWLKQVAYLASVFSAALILVFPLFAEKAVGRSDEASGASALSRIEDLFSSLISDLLASVGQATPPYLKPWSNAMSAHPVVFLVLAGLLGWSLAKGYALRDDIFDLARRAWTGRAPSGAVEETMGWAQQAAAGKREWRNSSLVSRLQRRFLPVAIGIAMYVVGLVVALHAVFTMMEGGGAVCGGKDRGKTAVFSTADVCWASGVHLVKGSKYRVTMTIDPDDPWYDLSTPSGVHGFAFSLLDVRNLAIGLRRWWTLDWFQPVIRIGEKGTSAFPLRPLDEAVAGAQHAGPQVSCAVGDTSAGKPLEGPCMLRPLPDRLRNDARAVWKKLELPRVLVAEFVAERSGEAYFYVNDVVLPSTTWQPFYGNNSGTAKIVVEPYAPPPLGSRF